MNINTGKIFEEAKTAGIPVESVNSDLIWTYTRELTDVEKDTLAVVIVNHDPDKPTLRELAKQDIRDRYITAVNDLEMIINFENPTLQQMEQAIKLVASDLLLIYKFIKEESGV